MPELESESMEPHEANSLYMKLVELLRPAAPWAAEQIEDTVRTGRPVAKQVRAAKRGEAETVALVVAGTKLREDQFAATEELSPYEKVLVALEAVETLLVDPPNIDSSVKETFGVVGVTTMSFAEPTGSETAPIHPVPIPENRRERLTSLIQQVTKEARDGR
jgi:hypothetical protein